MGSSKNIVYVSINILASFPRSESIEENKFNDEWTQQPDGFIKGT